MFSVIKTYIFRLGILIDYTSYVICEKFAPWGNFWKDSENTQWQRDFEHTHAGLNMYIFIYAPNWKQLSVLWPCEMTEINKYVRHIHYIFLFFGQYELISELAVK